MLTVCVYVYLCVCVQEATSANGVSVYLQFPRDEFLPYLKTFWVINAIRFSDIRGNCRGTKKKSLEVEDSDIHLSKRKHRCSS